MAKVNSKIQIDTRMLKPLFKHTAIKFGQTKYDINVRFLNLAEKIARRETVRHNNRILFKRFLKIRKYSYNMPKSFVDPEARKRARFSFYKLKKFRRTSQYNVKNKRGKILYYLSQKRTYASEYAKNYKKPFISKKKKSFALSTIFLNTPFYWLKFKKHFANSRLQFFWNRRNLLSTSLPPSKDRREKTRTVGSFDKIWQRNFFKTYFKQYRVYFKPGYHYIRKNVFMLTNSQRKLRTNTSVKSNFDFNLFHILSECGLVISFRHFFLLVLQKQILLNDRIVETPFLPVAVFDIIKILGCPLTLLSNILLYSKYLSPRFNINTVFKNFFKRFQTPDFIEMNAKLMELVILPTINFWLPTLKSSQQKILFQLSEAFYQRYCTKQKKFGLGRLLR